MRGLRISVNSTITAGGRTAPIFAVIYGLSAKEMPADEIVVCKIKSLVVASNMNGNTQNGFLVFVRGSQDVVQVTTTSDDLPDEEVNQQNDDISLDEIPTNSKDSKIAKIYREEVYYPFIQDIRKNYYDMPDLPDGEVPEAYTAVSWMDGCHGQLKLTTQENVLDDEKNKKIITCKHSAARTAVEQACDVGPMFKITKGVVKTMPTESKSISPISFRISSILNELASTDPLTSGRVVILASH